MILPREVHSALGTCARSSSRELTRDGAWLWFSQYRAALEKKLQQMQLERQRAGETTGAAAAVEYMDWLEKQ